MSVDDGSTRAVRRAEFAAPGDGIGTRATPASGSSGRAGLPRRPARSGQPMSDDKEHSRAEPPPDQPSSEASQRATDLDSDRAADAAYMRPAGVEDAFAPREPEPLYSPPPPTVSPEERAEFGRPGGSSEPFAPLPGERIPPAHRSVAPPVHPGLTREYGRPPGMGEFDPEPGTRISPQLHKAESPWWKADARRDPWRDPRSPFWLGRPAIFTGGRPAQIEPEEDAEQARRGDRAGTRIRGRRACPGARSRSAVRAQCPAADSDRRGRCRHARRRRRVLVRDPRP